MQILETICNVIQGMSLIPLTPPKTLRLLSCPPYTHFFPAGPCSSLIQFTGFVQHQGVTHSTCSTHTTSQTRHTINSLVRGQAHTSKQYLTVDAEPLTNPAILLPGQGVPYTCPLPGLSWHGCALCLYKFNFFLQETGHNTV